MRASQSVSKAVSKPVRQSDDKEESQLGRKAVNKKVRQAANRSVRHSVSQRAGLNASARGFACRCAVAGARRARRMTALLSG